MTRPFTARHRLRFAHCDPAGIAYYPRYLELCDAVIEEWTEAVIGVPRKELHFELEQGLPTVSLTANFSAVSRLGDWLDFALTVETLGRSSVDLSIEVTCGSERRFAVRYRQVLVDMAAMRPISWPAAWRARIEEVM